MKSWFAVVALLVGGSNLPAQRESPSALAVNGHVVLEGRALPTGLTLTIRGLGSNAPSVRIPVMSNGSFEYWALEPGEYEVKIINERGQVIDQEFVHLVPHQEPLTLHLRPTEPTPPRSLSGTVSARELLRSIPPKATKEFRASRKAFDKGDIPKSIEHLEKAIEIDPDYTDAHNDLGARLMALNQPDRAAAEFQKTVTLDPTSTLGQLNLSLALSSLRRFSEAETAARKALELEPSSIRGHYVLGQIFAIQDKNLPEAVEHLRRAVEQFPNARLLLARTLVLQGAVDKAAAELREYLKRDDADKRQLAEDWLARLSDAVPK